MVALSYLISALIYLETLRKFQNLAFVDVETTGLDAKQDRVIEVGLVKIDRTGSITRYSQLINPGFKISKFTRDMTGIKLKELNAAPLFGDVIPQLKELLRVDLFIAHNSRFDFEFISEEFGRYGHELAIPHLDTVKLAKTFYPNYLTYNLDSIISRLKYKIEKRHRGLDDALVLVALFNKIKQEFGEEVLFEEVEKIIVAPKKRYFIKNTQVSFL